MGEDEQRNERALEPATKRDDMQLVRTMTPEQLGGEIRLLAAQARRMALSYAIQIGYRLKVAHDKVGPHGWAEWLKRETDFSAAAASRLQALYEGYGEDQGSFFGVGNKFPTLEKISVSNALALLAVPEEEREQVAAEVDAEHLSKRELEKALAERDEAKAAAKKAIDDMTQILRSAQDDKRKAEEEAERMAEERVELLGKLEAAERRAVEDAGPYKEKLAEAQRQIKELESRPVEVAVERDEKAIQEAADAARKAAEDAARTEMDKLRAKLEKAEKAKEKAEAEAKRAAEDAGPYKAKMEAEAQAAKAEAEALRKKLLSAESGANVVAALFSLGQQNLNSALDKVIAMKATHPDVADKLLLGMDMFLTGFVEKVKKERSDEGIAPYAKNGEARG